MRWSSNICTFQVSHTQLSREKIEARDCVLNSFFSPKNEIIFSFFPSRRAINSSSDPTPLRWWTWKGVWIKIFTRKKVTLLWILQVDIDCVIKSRFSQFHKFTVYLSSLRSLLKESFPGVELDGLAACIWRIYDTDLDGKISFRFLKVEQNHHIDNHDGCRHDEDKWQGKRRRLLTLKWWCKPRQFYLENIKY